jgi:predicted amidophosphoribosyltransferase
MSGVLWALLVFIGNLIGLIIYLIVRQDHPIPARNKAALAAAEAPSALTSLSCPNCQKPVEKTFTYCPHCGAELQPVCRNCGKPAESAWKVCPHCGAQLKTE